MFSNIACVLGLVLSIAVWHLESKAIGQTHSLGKLGVILCKSISCREMCYFDAWMLL